MAFLLLAIKSLDRIRQQQYAPVSGLGILSHCSSRAPLLIRQLLSCYCTHTWIALPPFFPPSLLTSYLPLWALGPGHLPQEGQCQLSQEHCLLTFLASWSDLSHSTFNLSDMPYCTPFLPHTHIDCFAGA